MIKLGITKRAKEVYTPYFWIGNQGFDLAVATDLESARFSIKMVEVAFKKLNPQGKIEHIKGLKHYWGG